MSENIMRTIGVSKITVNMGLKSTGEELEKAYTLIERITGVKPVKTKANRTARTFGIRPGLNIGVKATMRGKKAIEFLRKMFEAKQIIDIKSFDTQGNFSFGIEEYLNVPGMKYDPKIGILGFDVCVTLKRPGFSIKLKRNPRKIGKTHKITPEEAIEYIRNNFNVTVEKVEKGDRFEL